MNTTHDAILSLLRENFRIPRGEAPSIAKWLGVGESSLYRYINTTPPSKAVISRIYHQRGVHPEIWHMPPEALQVRLYAAYREAKKSTEPKTISLSDIF